MLIDKITGAKAGFGQTPAAGALLTAKGSKYLLERIVKWVLFLLAAVSLLTTVGIVSVLLFEGVRFFTADFYQEKRSEVTVSASAGAEGAAGVVSQVAAGAEGAAGAVSQAAAGAEGATGTVSQAAAGAEGAAGMVSQVSVRATAEGLVYVSWLPPATGPAAGPASGEAPATGAALGAAAVGYAVSIAPALETRLDDCLGLAAGRTECVIAGASPGRSYRVGVAARDAAGGLGPELQTASFAAPESVRWYRYFTDTKWRTLLVPRSYGIWPLLTGTLMVAGLAMVIAVPLGLLSAIFLSEYAPPRMRAVTKPVLEVLAGIPTVVYGFFALFFITPALRLVGDEVGIFNALSAAVVMGVMILPMVSSLSEDAMRAVPAALREGAYALGATKMEVALKVVVPAALSGIVGAFILALSRAVGETMIVFIAAGQNDRLTFNPLDPVNTMTGFMAATNFSDNAIPGTAQFQALFAVGITLFIITLLMNLVSQAVVAKFREVYE